MFYLRIHKKSNDVMVAACDEEILGKEYNEGEIQLNVEEDFYKGDVVGEEEILDAIANAMIANLVGNRVVETAVKHGFVNEESIVTVDGVKHAQIVYML